MEVHLKSRAQGPLRKKRKEESVLRNVAYDSCVYLNFNFPQTVFLTSLLTEVWCGVFVHCVEQLAGTCRFHFWDPADVLTDQQCDDVACLPATALRKMERLFPSKAITECLMKIGCMHLPLCSWQSALVWEWTCQVCKTKTSSVPEFVFLCSNLQHIVWMSMFVWM